MSDAIASAGGAAVGGTPVTRPETNYVPGVTVAVLRDALDLMEVQGEALVSMIDSASEIRAAVAAQTITDPLTAQQVDLLA